MLKYAQFPVTAILRSSKAYYYEVIKKKGAEAPQGQGLMTLDDASSPVATLAAVLLSRPVVLASRDSQRMAFPTMLPDIEPKSNIY